MFILYMRPIKIGPVVYIEIYVQPIQNINACPLHMLAYVYILITYK